MRASRSILAFIAAILMVSLTALPASSHGSSSIDVNYPIIDSGFPFGSINSSARMDVSPNHYRLTIKVELQASQGGGWTVIDTTTNEKIQSGFIQASVGNTCIPPTGGGVRLATYYRVRLVYARAYNQSGGPPVHSYSNIYRPAGHSIAYSSFCSPPPFS